MKITLITDQIRIYGPKVDGSYKLELAIGEYETEALSQIIKLNKEKTTKITFEQE